MYELIGKVVVVLFILIIIYYIFYIFYRVISNEVKRRNDIKNFQHKIMDKDLEKELINFIKTGKIGNID